MLSFNRVSPTAIYTGHVWQKHGRSFQELRLPLGPLFYNFMWPAMSFSKMIGSPTLEDFLLARHDLIDHHLHDFIRSGGKHVIELASGYSPRGLRFIEHYGQQIQYTDTDLPDMAKNKARLLTGVLQDNANYTICSLDAFAVDGDKSLSHYISGFPENETVAVVAEGLLNYFSADHLSQLFDNLGHVFKDRKGSVFISDIHVRADNQGPLAEAFVEVLSAFVRGKVHLHYQGTAQAVEALAKSRLSGQLLKPSQFAETYESCRAKWADLVSILVAEPM